MKRRHIHGILGLVLATSFLLMYFTIMDTDVSEEELTQAKDSCLENDGLKEASYLVFKNSVIVTCNEREEYKAVGIEAFLFGEDRERHIIHSIEQDKSRLDKLKGSLGNLMNYIIPIVVILSLIITWMDSKKKKEAQNERKNES